MQGVLREERKKTSFDVSKVQRLLYGADLEPMLKSIDYLTKNFPADPNMFGEGRIQMMRQALKYCVTVLNMVDLNHQATFGAMLMYSQFQMPGTVHLAMFIVCLKLLGEPEHVSKLLEKSFTGQVIGCYAQTEMGHGSDIQSLMTTATFDPKTDEIILHTPCIEAMKFWPGDMGLYANYALVFARLLVEGNDMGVHAFLVKIRDDRLNPMPGVEVGDIGPKIGYITKDNGFLKLTHVRIPRSQMLSKIVGLSRKGELEVKGNPKIVYASMMIVRRFICAVWPKMYAQALTIAARYSMFRKQFRDDNHQQQSVIEYQLQQNKLIPLLAEYYALTIGGIGISKLTDENFKRVTENGDESLMAETHATLSFGKSYYSDVALRGIEMCRLACGGHGFSHYSGLPAIVNEYYPNPTHEGENTVMYLQAARYVMKCFGRSVLQKKEPLQHSVKYLESYDYLLTRKCRVASPDNWTVEQIRLLLAQTICQQISRIHEFQTKHKDIPKGKINNEHLGIQLVEMTITHSMYNTYYEFEQAIVKFMGDETAKKLLFQLCMLYGITSLQQMSAQLIMSGAVQPQHLEYLEIKREQLLKNLRPQLMGLIDGCAIPDSCLKSAIATGDCVYTEMLNLAKKNSLNINGNSIPAAMTIKKGLHPKL